MRIYQDMPPIPSPKPAHFDASPLALIVMEQLPNGLISQTYYDIGNMEVAVIRGKVEQQLGARVAIASRAKAEAMFVAAYLAGQNPKWQRMPDIPVH